MKNTVLYFLDDPSRDKHFHEYVLSGLIEAGYRPIVTYFWMDSKQPSRLKHAGFDVIDLGCTPKSYKGFHPSLISKVVNAIKAHNAIGAHVQRHHPLIYVAIAAKWTKLPALFYTIRLVRLLRTFNRRVAFRYISKSITKIIAVSNGVRDDFLCDSNFDKNKIVVIPNGVDPADFIVRLSKSECRSKYQLPDDSFLFGMVARLRKAKDHSGLITAFSQIKDRMPNALLVLAGDGPNEKKIVEKVDRYGLNNRVLFLGRLSPSDIPILLKGLDIFVHPTWREGMPAAVLEAMASGLPIIATDAEGVTDIFETKLDIGRMVSRGGVDQLAEAMLELYEMPVATRMQMGQNATQRIKETFTHQMMINRTVDLYNHHLGHLKT